MSSCWRRIVHDEPVTFGSLERSFPWDEKLMVHTESFIVADESGRVVLFSPPLEAVHVASVTGDKGWGSTVGDHPAELGDPAFYRGLARPSPRAALTMLTHGALVELAGWTIPAPVPAAVLDVICAQVEHVTDVWVVGTSDLQGVGFLSVAPASDARAA